MSIGKYSPNLPNTAADCFNYNSHGELSNFKDGDTWDAEYHFVDYDIDGFDYYGYSAINANGEFVGIGNGIDRNGYTEAEYAIGDNLQ